MGKAKFSCDYRNLTIAFNEFHDMKLKDLPVYGEFCLIELKEGGYTAGEWHPDDACREGKSLSGQFIRGLADSIPVDEVSKWHSLERYDLSDCLKQEDIGLINNGVPGDDIYSFKISGFKSLKDGDAPMNARYCLLILKDGGMSGGRWEKWRKKSDGWFEHSSGGINIGKEKVWAWAPLSPDKFSVAEEELEAERRHEEELNRNPFADPVKFEYGTDIKVYYAKALRKLKKKYPWATQAQMKKKTPWQIVPLHGQYVFGQVSKSFYDTDIVDEWKDGTTADEFIDFLCEYSEEPVKDSDPNRKFRLGQDIEVYIEKAFENVKKDYHWLDRKTADAQYRYEIKKIGGSLEFVVYYGDSKNYYVCDCDSSERFIEIVEHDYQNAALRANSVVSSYEVNFGHVEIHGWNLERYVFSKLQSGDYKVDVQAGDRVTGGGREFFITPSCFEADTYEEFLDRYLEIVPGRSFGLYKEDLLPDKKLKEFLGY